MFECGSMSRASSSTTRAKALDFYTNTLGFQKKTDIPLGGASWLTVVSPEQPDGTELLLEPSGHPAVKPYKKALVEDGIPAASFAVDDVQAEFDRLRVEGRAVHAGTDRDGRRHHGRLRRHLRQPHPDRQGALGARAVAHALGPPSGHVVRTARARPPAQVPRALIGRPIFEFRLRGWRRSGKRPPEPVREHLQSSAVIVQSRAGVLLIDPGIQGSELACLANDQLALADQHTLRDLASTGGLLPLVGRTARCRGDVGRLPTGPPTPGPTASPSSPCSARWSRPRRRPRR